MIAIIDYGMGNLRSVQKAFQRVGHDAIITDEPARLAEAAKIVLPGVGAFGDAMDELRRRKLIEPTLEAISQGKPFLGICLGLALLFETSSEFGQHAGLGVLKGKVVRFELPHEFKVPHMGWNQIAVRRRPPILEGIPDGSHFYFVHSYYVVPAEEEVIACETDFGGMFTSMIWRDHVYATQFHPEKSQRDGLRLLQQFAELG